MSQCGFYGFFSTNRGSGSRTSLWRGVLLLARDSPGNAVLAYPVDVLSRPVQRGHNDVMPTPQYITIRGVISRATIEKLYEQKELV
jgi:hypothetical protein